jgi:hypothetical protein
MVEKSNPDDVTVAGEGRRRDHTATSYHPPSPQIEMSVFTGLM